MRLDKFNEYNSAGDMDLFHTIANNLGDEDLYIKLGKGLTPITTSFDDNGGGNKRFHFMHVVNINGDDNFKRLIKDAVARFIDSGFLELRIGPPQLGRSTSSYYSSGGSWFNMERNFRYGTEVINRSNAYINRSATVLNSVEQFNDIIDATDFSRDIHTYDPTYDKGVIFFILE